MNKNKDILLRNYFKNTPNDPNCPHDNQIEASKEIMMKFKNGINWCILLAQPQVGKTGVMTQINRQLYDPDVLKMCGLNDYGLVILCGMSSTELRNQTMQRLNTGDGEKYTEVLFNKQIQKKLKHKKYIKKYWNGKYIIMIDESHYGQDINSSIDKFLLRILFSHDKKNEITIDDLINYKKWDNKRVKIVSVSASPFSELENYCKHNNSIGKVILKPGNMYYGIENFLNDKKVRNPINFSYSEKCTDFFKQFERDIHQKKFILIRLPNILKSRMDVIGNIKKIGRSFVPKLKFWSYDSGQLNAEDVKYIDKLNEKLLHEPKYPTVIFILGKLRAGYTLETKNISIVHDNYVSTPKCDVVIQSLSGRCCGYDKNNNLKIFCDIESIKKYIEFVKSNFEKVPNTGKNLTGNKKVPTTGNELFNAARTETMSDENYERNESDDDDGCGIISDDKLENLKREIEQRDADIQRKFSNRLKMNYSGCAVCGKKMPLEGAHIIPYNETHNFDLENGILLCRNHHYLFDAYSFSINPDTLKIKLSKLMKDDCDEINYSCKKIDIPNIINLTKFKSNVAEHYNKFISKNNAK